MKTKKEIKAKVEKINNLFVEKVERNDKSDWDYWVAYREALRWVLEEE